MSENIRRFQIIYGQQSFPRSVTKSIFLLGPIPRTAETKSMSWKPEAYRLLEQAGYEGVVYDPEHEEAPDRTDVNYDNSPQIDWEVKAMQRADVIVAWIPRQFPDMPAMTSNIEMGEFFKSGKLIIGYPKDTPRMAYMDYRATKWLQEAYKWQVPVYGNLKDILQSALLRIDRGAYREGVETAIPLNIWQDLSFQKWYQNLEVDGNHLEDFKVEYVYYRRQDKFGRPVPKVWVARPKIWIANENRFKDNEVIVGRPATVSVLMYYPDGDNVMDCKIVLVKEFRPAVSNYISAVCELPGGSIEPLEGHHDSETIRASALREVEEELGGLKLDPSRIWQTDMRQTMSTMLVHDSHLFSYRLDDDEMQFILDLGLKGQTPSEDNAENTVAIVTTVGELLDGNKWPPVDWVNMGMIMTVVARTTLPRLRSAEI